MEKASKKANLSEPDGPSQSPPGPSLEARGDAIAELPTPLVAASHMNETVDSESKESQSKTFEQRD